MDRDNGFRERLDLIGHLLQFAHDLFPSLSSQSSAERLSDSDPEIQARPVKKSKGGLEFAFMGLLRVMLLNAVQLVLTLSARY